MKCCGNCVNDRYLQKEISLKSKLVGNCDFCFSKDVNLIDPAVFEEDFDKICAIYEVAEDGKHLVDWLNEDWQIFALDRTQAQRLLEEILADNERSQQRYKPRDSNGSEILHAWDVLQTELRTKNRFFPTTDFRTDRGASRLESLRIPSAEVSQVWYRARIEEGRAFKPNEMGAPPARRAGSGRANPVGIAYLYVGSTQQTAVTEVRPHAGEILSVAEFNVNQNLDLIDLRSPRLMITPFVMEDSTKVAELRSDTSFLEKLGDELTTPVLPHAVQIDYIPSQYLCEFIKISGFDGVIYKSSVSSGVNLALFSPSDATVGNLSRVKIDSIGVEYQQLV